MKNSIVGGKEQIKLDLDYEPNNLTSLEEAIPTADYNPWKDTKVHEDAVEPIEELVDYIQVQGYTPYITSGYRSSVEQAAIHKSNPNESASAGGSQHQTGLAFDMHYLIDNETGEMIQLDESEIYDDVIEKAASIGIAHPLDWDYPHFFVAEAVAPEITSYLNEQVLSEETYYDDLNDYLSYLWELCQPK